MHPLLSAQITQFIVEDRLQDAEEQRLRRSVAPARSTIRAGAANALRWTAQRLDPDRPRTVSSRTTSPAGC